MPTTIGRSRRGGYTCTFSRASYPGDVFPKSFVAWTYAGLPKAGKVPVSFGIDQQTPHAPNPQVSCSGLPVDHGYPGGGPIGVGVFMDKLTRRPNIARIPVKALLANLRKRRHPAVTVPGFDSVLGSCGGCSLPMANSDFAHFEWKLKAWLEKAP